MSEPQSDPQANDGRCCGLNIHAAWMAGLAVGGVVLMAAGLEPLGLSCIFVGVALLVKQWDDALRSRRGPQPQQK